MSSPFPLADPATWFTNALIDAAAIKSRIIDPLNALPRGFLDGGDSSGSGTVALETITAPYASLASVAFTVADGESRMKQIHVKARYQLGTTTGGQMTIQAAYCTGPDLTAIINSFRRVTGAYTGIGTLAFILNNSATVGINGTDTADATGSDAFDAGEYCAFAVCTRTVGGDTTDLASSFYVAVEDMGAAPS